MPDHDCEKLISSYNPIVASLNHTAYLILCNNIIRCGDRKRKKAVPS